LDVLNYATEFAQRYIPSKLTKKSVKNYAALTAAYTYWHMTIYNVYNYTVQQIKCLRFILELKKYN
jgi:hypothetical protein